MFPYITREKWSILCRERSRCSRSIHDIETSICLLHKPCPSRAEVRECRLSKLCYENIEISPLRIDRGIEGFRWDMVSVWSKSLEVECMIPDLSRVIEYSSRRSCLHDLFERHILVLGSGNELVQIVHVGLVMLAIVVLECLTRDIWLECIESVWECRKCMSHRNED